MSTSFGAVTSSLGWKNVLEWEMSPYLCTIFVLNTTGLQDCILKLFCLRDRDCFSPNVILAIVSFVKIPSFSMLSNKINVFAWWQFLHWNTPSVVVWFGNLGLLFFSAWELKQMWIKLSSKWEFFLPPLTTLQWLYLPLAVLALTYNNSFYKRYNLGELQDKVSMLCELDPKNCPFFKYNYSLFPFGDTYCTSYGT